MFQSRFMFVRLDFLGYSSAIEMIKTAIVCCTECSLFPSTGAYSRLIF